MPTPEVFDETSLEILKFFVNVCNRRQEYNTSTPVTLNVSQLAKLLNIVHGKYVHFGNIEVRNVSALLWTLGEDGTGGWTAKTLLDDIIMDTRNIVDGAVSLEKLSDGVIKYFDDNH